MCRVPILHSRWYCRIEGAGRRRVTAVEPRPARADLRVDVPADAVGRRGGLPLGGAEAAPRLDELPLELAYLVGGARGLRRAPLGLAPARFGLLGPALALGLLLRAPSLRAVRLPLRGFAAPQEPESAARLDVGEHLEPGGRELRGEPA